MPAPKVGAFGRWKIFFGRCPCCDGRLKSLVAIEESYTRKKQVPMSVGTNPAPFMVEIRVTPVYSVCSRCGFRTRRGSIRSAPGSNFQVLNPAFVGA